MYLSAGSIIQGCNAQSYPTPRGSRNGRPDRTDGVLATAALAAHGGLAVTAAGGGGGGAARGGGHGVAAVTGGHTATTAASCSAQFVGFSKNPIHWLTREVSRILHKR